MLDGRLPVNHAILANLQDIFNLLPNLSTPKSSSAADGPASVVPAVENTELARAMSVKTNDQLMSIYLSSLVRAITAFHDLIDNKIQNKQQREDREQKIEDDKLDAKIGKEDKLQLTDDATPAGADKSADKTSDKTSTDGAKKDS